MYLTISLPKNLRTELMLEQRHIPCLCRIHGQFEILFQKPLPEAQGVVQGWDIRDIDERSYALAGGPYIHHAFGTVSLEQIDSDFYRITDLVFFSEEAGWCSIVANGNLAPARSVDNREYFDETSIPE